MNKGSFFVRITWSGVIGPDFTNVSASLLAQNSKVFTELSQWPTTF